MVPILPKQVFLFQFDYLNEIENKRKWNKNKSHRK